MTGNEKEETIEMHKKTNLDEKIIWSFYILMGAVFLPVLFCVFFVDGHIKYYERWRIITLLPNTALFVIALFGVSAVCLSAWMLRKMELTAKANTITNLALAFLFV